MRYTIRDGAKRPLSGRAKDNLRYLLPLLVVMAGVLFFALSPGGGKTGSKPFTLGVYTINSPDNSGKDSNNNKTGSGSSGNSNLDGSLGASTVSPVLSGGGIASSISAPTATASTGTITGGMGGGDISTTPVNPTSTTSSCVDQLTQATTVCVFPYQYCTVPLVGVTGAKTIDGTCIKIN